MQVAISSHFISIAPQLLDPNLTYPYQKHHDLHCKMWNVVWKYLLLTTAVSWYRKLLMESFETGPKLDMLWCQKLPGCSDYSLVRLNISLVYMLFIINKTRRNGEPLRPYPPFMSFETGVKLCFQEWNWLRNHENPSTSFFGICKTSIRPLSPYNYRAASFSPGSNPSCGPALDERIKNK